MKRYLPDVNALLALLDPMHVHHDAAHRWYEEHAPLRMRMCSHVENGVIRVASQPKYPNCLGTSGRVRQVLQEFVRSVNADSCDHDISLLDDGILLIPGLLTPSRIADLYLLALASSHTARLATIDQRIPAEAVRGGREALGVIPVPTITEK